MQTRLQSIPSQGESQAWLERRGTALFWILSLALVAVFHEPLWQLYLITGQERHYSHIVLVPLVSAYFFWSLRRGIFEPRSVSGRWAGGLLAALGALLAAVSQQVSLPSNDGLSLTIFALLLVWSGLFGILKGSEPLRQAAFPMLFLLFMVPIPSLLLDWIISLLQRGSAEVAYLAIQLSGTPILRIGEYFFLPGLEIHVAPECSGIRSGLALVITAVVAGWMMLQSGWNRLALALVAIPITIFKNGLRIAVLCLLSAYVDPGFLSGDLHTRGGYPFFLLALAFMAPVLWLLRRAESGSLAQRRKDAKNAK